MNKSAVTVDFTTAFGRLLRDGLLRDALAANPRAVVAQLDVREEDRPALWQLVPEDLEYQAEILLRKRFGLVRQIMPLTIERLKNEAWPIFRRYARVHWPAGENIAPRDAHGFARFLRQHQPASICNPEWNRLNFANRQKWLAIHWVREAGDSQPNRRALQVLIFAGKQLREFFFYLGI